MPLLHANRSFQSDDVSHLIGGHRHLRVFIITKHNKYSPSASTYIISAVILKFSKSYCTVYINLYYIYKMILATKPNLKIIDKNRLHISRRPKLSAWLLLSRKVPSIAKDIRIHSQPKVRFGKNFGRTLSTKKF